MARFFLHKPLKGKGLLLIVQSGMLDHLPTRVAVPLLPINEAGSPANRLNPTFEFEGDRYLMATHFIATFTIAELGPRVGSLESEHDRIMEALDMLILGF
jgi:toxin CcdB